MASTFLQLRRVLMRRGVTCLGRNWRRSLVVLGLMALACPIRAQAPPERVPPPEPATQTTPRLPQGTSVEEVESPPGSSTVRGAESVDSDTFPLGLSLADVIASVYQCYPTVLAAREQYRRTQGDWITAWGAYDTKLKASTINEPTGFYENYRHAIGAARQSWWGGYLSAGYRIGRGDFQPWYKERETDKGGELKVGWTQPLLQGRAIDLERVSVFQASLARQAARPQVQQAILETAHVATTVYWEWVGAGQALRAQQALLDLAEKRGRQYEAGVATGKFAEIDLILNRQLIAERRGFVLQAERKFQTTAYKLSLFLRNERCEPMVAPASWLPASFPVTERPADTDLEQEISASLGRRPEPQMLRLAIQQVAWDRAAAGNQLLPNLDLIAEASQDLGPQATSSDDKDEFLLVVGLQGDVPIQRRKARGKVQSTSAKIAQLRQKLWLQENKIEAELRATHYALTIAADLVEQAGISLEAAIESLKRYRFAFDRGKIDLIYLNLLETKANEAEIKRIKAQGDWFVTLGDLQAVLGLDPLTQAMNVASLPLDERPDPAAQLEAPLDANLLQRDWEIHRLPPENPQ